MTWNGQMFVFTIWKIYEKLMKWNDTDDDESDDDYDDDEAFEWIQKLSLVFKFSPTTSQPEADTVHFHFHFH
jgi:hypothetical protein